MNPAKLTGVTATLVSPAGPNTPRSVCYSTQDLALKLPTTLTRLQSQVDTERLRAADLSAGGAPLLRRPGHRGLCSPCPSLSVQKRPTLSPPHPALCHGTGPPGSEFWALTWKDSSEEGGVEAMLRFKAVYFTGELISEHLRDGYPSRFRLSCVLCSGWSPCSECNFWGQS